MLKMQRINIAPQKTIRRMLGENLDIARTGKKILVAHKRLEDFLRNEI